MPPATVATYQVTAAPVLDFSGGHKAGRWSAGQALMKSTNLCGWATLAAEINLVEANHDALSACREAAAKTRKEQHCTIVVPAP